MPTRLVGDAGRIRQVLTNLIGNAVKFTQGGSVTVRVVGRPGGPGFRHVTVSVEDTGIGIAPEMRRHIFGEFNQVEDEMNRKFDGTGLGLAITKSLIELMSGEIWLDSDLGKGSCFSFRLKLPVADKDQSERRVPDWVERAFLIDPDDRSRQLTTSQLVALGLPVVSVVDTTKMASMPVGERDILVMSDHSGEAANCDQFRRLVEQLRPAVALVLTRTLTSPVTDRTLRILPHPVLRQHLLDVLGDLERPGASDAAAPPEEIAAPHPPRRLRLLAAEDNKTNQLVFAKMLAGFDIDLVFADDGIDAVEKFRALRPDIVFTDISMPRMDGKQAAAEIRRLEADMGLGHVPIVAMTAHALEGDAETILAAGIDHYLTKPIRKSDLVAQLERAVTGEMLPPCRPGPSTAIAS
jgi:CheY-like chemotaxis protein